MQHRFEIGDRIWLDARRAIWFAEEQALAVADLHLGYAWAQRHAGHLLPLSAPDNTLPRLLALCSEYQPRQIVFLGDIVHKALDIPSITSELDTLLRALCVRCQIRLVAGNHDRHLAKLLAKLQFPGELESHVTVGSHHLRHSDLEPGTAIVGGANVPNVAAGFTVIGHEHPAVRLSDGFASSFKVPCFLVGKRVIVLPAFSDWAAGVTPDRGFMSETARSEEFTRAIAIVAGKLLPLPWPGLNCAPAANATARFSIS